MIILNLGCGTKTSNVEGVINIDWSPILRIKKSKILRSLSGVLLSGERKDKFAAIPENIFVTDISKGIPYHSESVDAVYSSHLLEHLDRHVSRVFVKEVYRVLKPNGIARTVVPDFEFLCENYLRSIKKNHDAPDKHEYYISEIIEQCVRKESYGTGKQNYVRRKIENILLGDARKRGETHQWMYDRITLSELMLSSGFRSTKQCTYKESKIPRWSDIGLDCTVDGAEYKPGSLYLESVK